MLGLLEDFQPGYRPTDRRAWDNILYLVPLFGLVFVGAHGTDDHPFAQIQRYCCDLSVFNIRQE